MASASPVVVETPTVPSAKSASWTIQRIAAAVKMAATSIMTAPWAQPASTATAPTPAPHSRNAVPTQSAKPFRIPPHANAPRVPESSIRPTWPACQPRWICQPSVASETVIVHLV